MYTSSRHVVFFAGLILSAASSSFAQSPAPLPPLPEGARTWLERGLETRDLSVLGAVHDHPGTPAKLQRVAARALARLGARRYLGRWIPRAELRRRVGLEQASDGSWVPSLRVRLQEARKRFKPWPAVTPALLEDWAHHGKLAPGMNRELALAGGGHPKRVVRVREDRVWEAWEFADGRRVFLRDGIVFEVFR